MKTASFLLAVLALSALSSVNANASALPTDLPPAKCEKDYRSFADWKKELRQEALANGVSVQTWEQADSQIISSPTILAKDRSQGGFYKPFLDFAIPRSHPRIAPARAIFAKHAATLNRIKNEKGVAPEVIAAFWGMETDFRIGRAKNQYPVLTSMATLAFDCRRAAYFRLNLVSALKLIEAREVALTDLVGEWAGEMSGLQFTPSNYLSFAEDFDRNGKRDPVNSVGDMFATAANMFKEYGWRANEPYLLEVRVPESLPWEEADMTATRMRPLNFWASHGVTTATGAPLPYQSMQGALMLPMGRLGPAFIAFPNFRTLLKWNASSNNALTAAYLATRIASTNVPAMSKGRGTPEVMTSADLKQIQTLLAARGYDVGKIDGFIGTGTREAVRDMQMKLGLPADAYPTHELMAKLR